MVTARVTSTAVTVSVRVRCADSTQVRYEITGYLVTHNGPPDLKFAVTPRIVDGHPDLFDRHVTELSTGMLIGKHANSESAAVSAFVTRVGAFGWEHVREKVVGQSAVKDLPLVRLVDGDLVLVETAKETADAPW